MGWQVTPPLCLAYLQLCFFFAWWGKKNKAKENRKKPSISFLVYSSPIPPVSPTLSITCKLPETHTRLEMLWAQAELSTASQGRRIAWTCPDCARCGSPKLTLKHARNKHTLGKILILPDISCSNWVCRKPAAGFQKGFQFHQWLCTDRAPTAPGEGLLLRVNAHRCPCPHSTERVNGCWLH